MIRSEKIKRAKKKGKKEAIFNINRLIGTGINL
jgi:hypothetical protein